MVPVVGDSLDAHAFDTSIPLAHQLGAAITGFIVEPFVQAHVPGALPVAASGDAPLRAHALDVLKRGCGRALRAGAARMACRGDP